MVIKHLKSSLSIHNVSSVARKYIYIYPEEFSPGATWGLNKVLSKILANTLNHFYWQGLAS